MIEFGGLLGTAPVMKVNGASSVDFISRGGQIPAPIHSFKIKKIGEILSSI
ncbi:hypothetical protein SMI10712_01750 [Streptococcus mitis]|uniref:Uncharacterized protein n=1 Tax=Streptococcus mitis TaxID=28037 RepID=A0A150NKA8_STRMT|nr:hypothetical protein SMI10712_01750 [Streptococcus mitis]